MGAFSVRTVEVSHFITAAVVFPAAWVVPLYAQPRTLGVLDGSNVANCTGSACVGHAVPGIKVCGHEKSPALLITIHVTPLRMLYQ